MKKPLVYVASAYTKGDVAVNVRFQCEQFDDLVGDGIVTPLVPLWSHFQHTLFPRPYKDWVQYDNEIIPRCDALLRLDVIQTVGGQGYFQCESSGADAEVALAVSLGIPVFYSVGELYQWVNERNWRDRHGIPQPKLAEGTIQP